MTRTTPAKDKKPLTLFRNEKHPLMAVTGLVVFSLAIVSYTAITGNGRTETRAVTIVGERTLVITDEADGAVAVFDAQTNVLLGRYEGGEGGFARTAVRALAYTRASHNIPHTRPIALQRASGGRLYLHDPETGRTIDLDAFGAANAAEFSRWLDIPAPDGRPS